MNPLTEPLVKPDTSGVVDSILSKARLMAGKAIDKDRNEGKARILIAGKTGVGKSTLLNAIFSEDLAKVGVGEPVTQEITEFERDNFPLIIADSKGLEGEDYEAIVEDLKSYVEQSIRTGDEKDAVHFAWYCVAGDGARYEDGEANIVQTLSEAGIPVVIILTKGRIFRGDGFREGSKEAELRDYIMQKSGDFIKGVVLVRSESEEDEDDDGNIIFKKPKGLDTLIQVTERYLAQGKQNAFIQALNVRNETALKLKEDAAREVVNWATAAATAAAAAPLPGADILALSPIQGIMLYKIGNHYGVNTEGTNWTNVITAVAAPLVAGMVARSVVGGLFKLVPVGGTIVGGIISGSSAGVVTKMIGESYIDVLNSLAREAIAKGEPTNIAPELAFNNLADAIRRKKQDK